MKNQTLKIAGYLCRAYIGTSVQRKGMPDITLTQTCVKSVIRQVCKSEGLDFTIISNCEGRWFDSVITHKVITEKTIILEIFVETIAETLKVSKVAQTLRDYLSQSSIPVSVLKVYEPLE